MQGVELRLPAWAEWSFVPSVAIGISHEKRRCFSTKAFHAERRFSIGRRAKRGVLLGGVKARPTDRSECGFVPSAAIGISREKRRCFSTKAFHAESCFSIGRRAKRGLLLDARLGAVGRWSRACAARRRARNSERWRRSVMKGRFL